MMMYIKKGKYEMEDFKDLKKLVSELESEDKANEEEQIKILQKIEAKLINEYEIVIDNLVIRPMLVEAYYFNKEKFPDIAVHASKENGKIAELAHKRQQKNFGKLYIHCPKGDGIDICLTDSDKYYLSFLIKNSIVNGEWTTQNGLADKLCDENCKKCEKIEDCIYNDTVVLKKRNSPLNSKIVYIPRKGISGNFVCAPLAALPVDELKEEKYEFTTPTGYKKQWRMAVYALIKGNMDEEKAVEYLKTHNLYKSKIENQYWILAKHTLRNYQKD